MGKGEGKNNIARTRYQEPDIKNKIPRTRYQETRCVISELSARTVYIYE